MIQKLTAEKVCGFVKEKVPVFQWLPKYDAEKALGDLIAGITVGLTLIPQSIAYTALAGVEPQYGLYSSLLGGFIYFLFGTVKDLNIAPTALISLLTYSYTKDLPRPEAAILLCFLCGIVQILCGLLHLGFLVDFVSTPVVSAFTSAGALTIAASQLKSMLGLQFMTESFFDVFYKVFINLNKTNLNDAGLSLICCFSLLGLREMKRFGYPPLGPQKGKLKVILWFLSVGRNTLIVVVCALTAFLFNLHNLKPFTLTSKVPDGLPSLWVPFLVTNGTDTANITMEIFDGLGGGVFVVAFVAILSNMAIAKSFSGGKRLDASQEMFTVGFCNFLGSFLGSFPVNASFSRAALNNASGARTTFGGIYTGSMVIFALTFLTPYFAFIPKAALASVIFCAVIYMVEVKILLKLWKNNRIDLVPHLVTFIAALFLTIEKGIIIGILSDLVLMTWFHSRPKIIQKIETKGAESIKMVLYGSLLYSSSGYIRDSIMEATRSKSNVRWVILICDQVDRIDFTTAMTLSNLASDLSPEKRLIFVNLSENLQEKLQSTTKVKLQSVTVENFGNFDIDKVIRSSQVQKTDITTTF